MRHESAGNLEETHDVVKNKREEKQTKTELQRAKDIYPSGFETVKPVDSIQRCSSCALRGTGPSIHLIRMLEGAESLQCEVIRLT